MRARSFTVPRLGAICCPTPPQLPARLVMTKATLPRSPSPLTAARPGCLCLPRTIPFTSTASIVALPTPITAVRSVKVLLTRHRKRDPRNPADAFTAPLMAGRPGRATSGLPRAPPMLVLQYLNYALTILYIVSNPLEVLKLPTPSTPTPTPLCQALQPHTVV